MAAAAPARTYFHGPFWLGRCNLRCKQVSKEAFGEPQSSLVLLAKLVNPDEVLYEVGLALRVAGRFGQGLVSNVIGCINHIM